MSGFPFRDGTGPAPDSRWEILAWIGIAAMVIGAFTFFSGLDAKVEYAATAPSDYFLSTVDADASAVQFTEEDISLLNQVNSRSLGGDAVASERLYCAELRNGVVRNLRLADRIESSTLTSVAGGCLGSVDLWLHTQPSGSDQLSEEDKDLESTAASVTCIQYGEMAVSPLTDRVSGVNCWEIVDDGERFDQVPVLVK